MGRKINPKKITTQLDYNKYFEKEGIYEKK